MSYQSFLEHYGGESFLETISNAVPASRQEWIKGGIVVVAVSEAVQTFENGHFDIVDGISAPIIGVGILYGVRRGIDFLRDRIQPAATSQ